MNTAGDAWHEALRRLDKLAEVYTGSARIEEIRSWVERGGDGAAEAVDALTGGLVPDTGQAREQILQRDITFGEYVIAVCDAIGLPHDSPRAAVVEAIRAAVAAAQAPESPTDSTPKAGRGGSSEAETATDTVQAPDVAVERQARYQETACARRTAEERPDA